MQLRNTNLQSVNYNGVFQLNRFRSYGEAVERAEEPVVVIELFVGNAEGHF